jgi:hypothetical protein
VNGETVELMKAMRDSRDPNICNSLEFKAIISSCSATPTEFYAITSITMVNAI